MGSPVEVLVRAMLKHLVLGLSILISATSLSAQASRTWVSGVGDDANPGSRTAPCKTFAGAISKTAPGGEIDVLDPGGFGAVTLTKAITLDGGGGQVASILVSGTNAIVVAAGPTDVVILRNLRFDGIGMGLNGVRFISGKALVIDNCELMGFTQSGVDVALGNLGSVSISNTTIVGMPSSATSNGVTLEAGFSAASVSLDHVKVLNAGGKGIAAAAPNGDLQMDGVWLAGNATGLSVTGGAVRLSGCTITQNGVGTSILGGSVGSFGNNKVRANASGNGPIGGYLPLQLGSAGGSLPLQ